MKQRSAAMLHHIFLGLMILLAIKGLSIVTVYVGHVGAEFTTEAGTITEIEIIFEPRATLWAGVYGVSVRVPGFNNPQSVTLTNADLENENLLFDCLPSDETNELFASVDAESSIDWATMQPATTAEVDAFMGVDSDDIQSATNTFTSNISVVIGTTTINNVPATFTFEENRSLSAVYDVGIMKDGDGDLVYVAHINTNFTLGFNGDLVNYQILLPIPNDTTLDWNFFVDPFNDCPTGIGEVSPNGTVTGIVRDTLSVPLEGVIVVTAGVADYTNSLGNYSIDAPPGTFIIFAAKDGYEPYMNNVTIFANQTTVHNIVLEERPPETNATDVGPGEDDPGTKTESNTGQGPGIGPGQAPRRPVIEEPKKIEGTDYIITLNEIKQKIRVDSFIQTIISVISLRDLPAQVNIEIIGNVSELMQLDRTSFIVEAQNREDVTITLFGRPPVGVYNGSMEITGDFNATLPIEIEILTKDKMPVEALQLHLDVARKTLKAGETLKFQTNLRNFLIEQAYPVTLVYTIQNEDGSSTVFTHQTNTFIKTTNTLIHSAELPNTLESGDYILRVTAYYLDLTSSDSQIFTVELPWYKRMVFGLLPVWQLLLIILFLLLTAATIIYLRWRAQSKKKFHLKVELNELPKPGPRSIFVGKIAETSHKTYMNLEAFKTHTIVAGSTGGGKSFSAQVIIEEALLKGVAVIVFDPTAQWTGMLRKMSSKPILELYADFDMKKTEARSFPGNIRQINNPRELVEIKKVMKPGEIMIYACHKLDPKDMDTFVANTVREVFHEAFDESPLLRLMLVYDEVHRLLPKFGGSGQGFLQIERSCREFRKWGIGVMLISQVLSDFVGQIKANINTEIQMRTRDEGDLDRIKTRYGEGVLRSLVKATVGSGMVENPQYNRGKPYFIQFRPVLHSIERLKDDEIEKYNQYNELIDDLFYQLDQLETEHKIDVFDLKLELKLAQDKVKSGNFNMVDIYIEGLKPRIQKHWEKVGKQPKKYEVKMVSQKDIDEAIAKAKEERAKQDGGAAAAAPEKKREGSLGWKDDVPPDKILNLKNGMIVINLASLYDEVSAMKDDALSEEVAAHSFEKWVRTAIEDADLADHLAPVTTKAEILALLTLKKEGKKYGPIATAAPPVVAVAPAVISAAAAPSGAQPAAVQTTAAAQKAQPSQNEHHATGHDKSRTKVASDSTGETPEGTPTSVTIVSNLPIGGGSAAISSDVPMEKYFEQPPGEIAVPSNLEHAGQVGEASQAVRSAAEFMDAPATHAFHLQQGGQIWTLRELHTLAKNLPVDVYVHHTRQGSDFANWIAACLKFENLARLAQSAKNSQELATIIEDYARARGERL